MSVRAASPADEARVVEALARAFDGDAPFNWSIRQDHGRHRAFRLAFRAFFRRFLPLGMTYVAADGAGAALWCRDDQWRFPLWRELLDLPAYLRCCGDLERFLRATGTLETMRARHPKVPHYYLFVIGVDPDFRRRGLASALLQTVTERCDRERMPAYLEATSAENRVLYQRHGFEATGELRCARGGPPLTTMWRAPLPR